MSNFSVAEYQQIFGKCMSSEKACTQWSKITLKYTQKLTRLQRMIFTIQVSICNQCKIEAATLKWSAPGKSVSIITV